MFTEIIICAFGVPTALYLYMLVFPRPNASCFEERIERCCKDLREELRVLNAEVQDKVMGQLHHAVNNLAANTRYQFLEGHGPRRHRVTHEEPLFPRYACDGFGW